MELSAVVRGTKCRKKTYKLINKGKLSRTKDNGPRERAKPWTVEETRLLEQGRQVHGNDWVSLSKLVGTKTAEQVRKHKVLFDNIL